MITANNRNQIIAPSIIEDRTRNLIRQDSGTSSLLPASGLLRGRRRITDKGTVVEEYKDGKPMQEIGNVHGGVSREAIRQFLANKGITGKKLGRESGWKRKVSGEALKEIKKEHKERERSEEIARKLNISLSTVNRYLRVFRAKVRKRFQRARGKVPDAILGEMKKEGIYLHQ